MILNRIKLVLRYIKFYFSALTIYDIHGPLLFSFVQNVIEDKSSNPDFKLLENVRKELLKDRTVLQIEDLGAGSINDSSSQRSVQSIAQNALTSPYYCRILYKMIHQYKPQNMIELGTSLGLSALYQSKANPQGILNTIEGSQAVYDFAQGIIRDNCGKNVKMNIGNFDNVLGDVLKNIDSLDYAFIDGNHRYQPTIDYFELCLTKIETDAVLVFDDIYWSEGMNKAWKEILDHPRVKLSIDMFFLGIVFIKKDVLVEKHIKIVPRKLKPWRLGFFM